MITSPHDGVDVSAHMKIAFDIHAHRIARDDEFFENDGDDVLVKGLHVDKRDSVQLQTLELDAALVGNVLETDRCEVRKIRERTDRRKLGNFEVDPDLATGKLVGERVELKQGHLRTRRRLNIQALIIKSVFLHDLYRRT